MAMTLAGASRQFGHPTIVVLSATGAARTTMLEALRTERYAVELVAASEPVEEVLAARPDLVMVDAGAALRAQLCSQVRTVTTAPIVVIGQPDATDAADCLENGADDYLARPERPHECVARVRARLRRCPPQDEEDPPSLAAGGIVLDHDRHRVVVAGRIVHLPRKQFQLLELLMANAGRILTHRTIADRVWGYDGVDQNTLQAQVARLRKALGGDTATDRIRAVRGVGYTFQR